MVEKVGTSKIVESLNDLNIDLLRLKGIMLKEENDALKRSSKTLRYLRKMSTMQKLHVQ